MRTFYTPAELFKRFDVIKYQLDELDVDIYYTIYALNAPDYFGLSEKEAALKSDYVIEELTEMASAIDRAGLHYMTFGKRK